MKDLKVDFTGSLLYITARSPFARRVRLALREHGIPHEEKVLNLIQNPHPEYAAVNPLKRVPALRLRSGEILVDSNLILEAFYASVESPLRPPRHAMSRGEWIKSLYWSGVATGLAEKAVEFFLESLRPEDKRDAELLEEIEDARAATLAELEKEIGDRETLLPSGLSQADLDLGAMLGYLSLRMSRAWMKEYPRAARYYESLERRPSFQATFPPA